MSMSMWATTARCVGIWLKVTLVLGVLVVLAGVVYGWGSTVFTFAVVAAIGVDLLAVRGLIREWAFEASGCWWWLR